MKKKIDPDPWVPRYGPLPYGNARHDRVLVFFMENFHFLKNNIVIFKYLFCIFIGKKYKMVEKRK